MQKERFRVVRKVGKEVTQKRKKTPGRKTGSTLRKTSLDGNTKQGHLITADTERFKQILLEKRKEIVGNVNEMEDEALKKSRLDATGDLSSMPIHMADIGTDNYEQEFALGLMDSERKMLKEIDDALQRIENGTYGICEGTDKPIANARLKAKPWARYCVEYTRKLEQDLVTEQEQSMSESQEYKSTDKSE